MTLARHDIKSSRKVGRRTVIPRVRYRIGPERIVSVIAPALVESHTLSGTLSVPARAGAYRIGAVE